MVDIESVRRFATKQNGGMQMNVDNKSNKLTANFSTGMLMRVGSKETLEKCYRETGIRRNLFCDRC